ncbi:hypothetical protein WCX49_10445 [Sulfurimonas sp. HSL-1656]|uniref:TonB-dependent receptor n=1 Tax=Thiomicrolovo subterrani TaxID=3131934 RepID=UPI0031F7717D
MMKKTLIAIPLFCTLLFADAATILPVEKRTFEQSKFIPDISLILDASYVTRNKKDDEIAHYEIPGVAHGIMGAHAHDGHSHATYNAANGFNLNYGELVLSSSVDPYFTLDGTFHFSENGVEIEEAYFTSTSLPYGLRLRGGKLLSNFGRINSQHHHYWDFGDMPLIYQAFLGDHGINEKGVQLQWVAPTETYLMFGGEVLQGENEMMFGTGSIADPTATDPDAAPLAEAADAPALFVAYVKTAVDIGETTVMPGISYARGTSRLDHFEDEEPHAYAGMSSLYGFDLTVKHYFDSYSFLTWQSEWMMRDMKGTQYAQLDANTTASASLRKEQSGYYTQLVYAYNMNWRAGVRYDSIYKNDITKNGTALEMENSFERYSAMVEYHPSEFSRFRLQYNHNTALFNEDGERQSIDTFMLQANIAIGAHAAHDF